MLNNEKVQMLLGVVDSFYNKIVNSSALYYKEKMFNVFSCLKFISKNFPDFINNCFCDGFRYIDYYDEKYAFDESIQYFYDNYNEIDKEERLLEYCFYYLIKKLEELLILSDMEEFSDVNELLDLLNMDNYYENLESCANNLKERFLNNKEEELEEVKSSADIEMSFLNANNPYPIYFMGNSLNDLKKLPRDKQVKLIRKLNEILSVMKVIPNQENIDHVKDLYDVPIARIHFSKDYRVTFVRYLGITAILGFGFKTGKDIDYTRYDSVVRDTKMFYKEIEDFSKGLIPDGSKHHKVIEILSNNLKKFNDKKKATAMKL